MPSNVGAAGDSMSGSEAAALRWANRCYPDEQLEGAVLAQAQKVPVNPCRPLTLTLITAI